MLDPFMADARRVAPDTTLLGAWLPLPGIGTLPVNAFVIDGAAPVLVDTGLASLRADFMAALDRTIDPARLAWVWITHADPDHLGNLGPVLDAAPEARVVTTFVGMGKMAMHGLPVDRVRLVNPGQSLRLPDRELVAVAPPAYDAPETTALYDSRSRALFSADCFGALLQAPAESTAAVAPDALRDGIVAWAGVDAPWLHHLGDAAFDTTTRAVRELSPEYVLGGHLPPACDGVATLLGHLDAARGAAPFAGPDQAALEAMMAATPGKAA